MASKRYDEVPANYTEDDNKTLILLGKFYLDEEEKIHF